MNITINARLLIAAQKFAGKEDVRFYLNGVYVAPAPSGDGAVLVATDGHRMAVLHDPEGICDKPAIIATHKRPAISKRADTVTVTFTHPDSDDTTVSAAYSDGFIMLTEMIDATYPDWQAIIPQQRSDRDPLDCVPVAVNAKYVADLATIPTAYGHHHNNTCIQAFSTGCSMLCTFGDDIPAFAVIMPVRMEPVSIPGFMHSKDSTTTTATAEEA